MIQVDLQDFLSIVVGVDPALTSNEESDETGIIVAASGPHQPSTCNIDHCTVHAYVLQDATLPRHVKSTPERWGRRVVEVFDEWNAGRVVVEHNAGRDLLKSVLLTIRPTLPVELPNASLSKVARAEPIVSLYEQGRVHHIGKPEDFAILEDQMTTWVPNASRRNSPDRLDALVWAISALDINAISSGRRRWQDMGEITPVNFPQGNGWAV
jgi:phage terminase large subunit-like protein